MIEKEYWENVWNGKINFLAKNPTKDLPWDIKKYDSNLKYIIKNYTIKKGYSLDIGCGSGYDTAYLSKKGFKSIGIDISYKAIKICKKKHKLKNCFFKNMDFFECSFENYFNFLYDRGCLHNTIKINDYFVKCHNMLKNNGYLCCLMGNENDNDNTTVKPTKVNIINIIHTASNFFKIKLLKEINFEQSKNYKNGLGWLLLLNKKNI